MAFQNSKGKEGGCGDSLSWKSEGMRGFAIGILQAWRILDLEIFPPGTDKSV